MNKISLSTAYLCGSCKYVAREKKYLLIHRLMKHQQSAPFSCSECPYSTSCRANLKSHVIAHREAKTYKCGICHYITTAEAVFQQHMRKHIAEFSQTDRAVKDPKAVDLKNCDNPKEVTLRDSDSILLQHLYIKVSDDATGLSNCKLGPNLASPNEMQRKPVDKQKNINTGSKDHTSGLQPVVENLNGVTSGVYQDLNMTLVKAISEIDAMFTCKGMKRKIPNETKENSQTKKNCVNQISNQEQTNTPLAYKIFKCATCEFKTSKLQAIHGHVKQSHAETKAKVYNCKICLFKTSSKHSFYIHMGRHNK